MTPGPDPTRADKTAAWQGVEDDAHCACPLCSPGVRVPELGFQERPSFSGSQGPISPYMREGNEATRAASSVLTRWGAGAQQPRGGRPPVPAKREEILTDSLQVVSGLHVGRAHLHKRVADLVQHLSEKRSIRSGGGRWQPGLRGDGEAGPGEEWGLVRAWQPGVKERQRAERSHHSNCIVEQGLAEDDDKEGLVDVHLLKDSQHGHGVHC